MSESAAVTHSAPEPGSTTTRPAPSAGPTSIATPPRLSRRATTRSSVMPLCRATCGTRASRAVSPGTSPNEPTMPNGTNQPTPRPVITSASGSAATTPASKALPVVRSTTRGSTTAATELPRVEKPYEVR
ncbi:hypothetical protein ACFWR9_23385 [Streptomyces sp. NPDC058534]|uniref:hypothetical protein n=1 Tax=Streptomyces sp. NPDC058534 TaxID=3346541 RepID=UPI003661B1CB